MAHPRFREGRLSTGFIAEEFPSGFSGAEIDQSAENAMRALAVAFERANAERGAMISGRIAVRDAVVVPKAWTVREASGSTVIEIEDVDGGFEAIVGGETFRIIGDCGPTVRIFDGTVNGRPMPAQVDRQGLEYRVAWRGAARTLMVISARASELLDRMPAKAQSDLTKFLLSPMPGLLVSLAVEEGEAVKAGQELAVVEAMKMENVMRAERDVVVSAINAEPGDSLAVDQVIMEFE
jgi:propionyl-CoA carboxylase alpha chain